MVPEGKSLPIKKINKYLNLIHPVFTLDKTLSTATPSAFYCATQTKNFSATSRDWQSNSMLGQPSFVSLSWIVQVYLWYHYIFYALQGIVMSFCQKNIKKFLWLQFIKQKTLISVATSWLKWIETIKYWKSWWYPFFVSLYLRIHTDLSINCLILFRVINKMFLYCVYSNSLYSLISREHLPDLLL